MADGADTKSSLSAEQVTLNTLRQWAERTMAITAQAERRTASGGARQAASDILAILDMNGAPPDQPVHFRSVWD